MKNPLNLALFAMLTLGFTLSLQAQSNEEWGIASYYHDSFHGKETAYGVAYNKNAMTAAHRELPFGTMIRVTRLDNNKSVVVKVTDKGPYKRGRVVDLSRKAAERIGLVRDGLTEVKVEVIKRGAGQTTAQKKSRTAASSRDNIPGNYSNVSRDRLVTDAGNSPRQERASEPAAEKAAPKPARSKASAKKAAAATQPKGDSSAKPRLVGKGYQKYGLYKISIQEPGTQGFAVQVASLTNYENVFKQVADLQAKWFDNILISIEEGDRMPAYKILLGPFEKEGAAENYRENLMEKHRIKGFVVDLTTIEYGNQR